jgi:hypothetical protein
LMLGFEVAQSTVSKYMTRPSKPPSQTWKTFLQNHAEAIAEGQFQPRPRSTASGFSISTPATNLLHHPAKAVSPHA